MTIGQEFIQIVAKNLNTELSRAMNSLWSDLLHTEKEAAKEIVEQMVEDLKKEVNLYIDVQKDALLKLIDSF